MSDNPKALTPIRVRGKRDVPSPAKKRQRHVRTRALTAQQDSAPPYKKRQVKLSRLEDLPTELLEFIFVYSGNVDLPLTARSLLAQLSGQSLHEQIMHAALNPLLDMYKDDRAPSAAEVDQFSMLTSRRFCTYNLLCKCFGDDSDSIYSALDSIYSVLHRMPLWPRIPVKLLHGPWTNDKVAFLELYTEHRNDARDSRPALDPGMEAYDSIQDAIEEHSVLALPALHDLGFQSCMHHLRSAVIRHGCNRDIVVEVLDHMSSDPDGVFDPLDPELWAWSVQPDETAGGRGSWLQGLLKHHGDTYHEMMEELNETESESQAS